MRNRVIAQPDPPTVLCYVTAHALLRLREALEPGYRVDDAQDWDLLEHLATQTRPSVFFVDANVLGALNVPRISALAQRHGAERIVLYGALSPRLAASVAGLGVLGNNLLLLQHFEDSAHRVRLLTEDIAARPLADAVLHRMPANLLSEESQIGQSLIILFRYPRRFRVASDLAHAAQLPLRTLYRRFEGMSLASPRRMVLAARVLRAHWCMRVLGLTTTAAARALRYASPVSFARQARELFDLPPSELALAFTPEEMVERIAFESGFSGSAGRNRGSRQGAGPSLRRTTGGAPRGAGVTDRPAAVAVSTRADHRNRLSVRKCASPSSARTAPPAPIRP